jgi:hypothetical protein
VDMARYLVEAHVLEGRSVSELGLDDRRWFHDFLAILALYALLRLAELLWLARSWPAPAPVTGHARSMEKVRSTR